MRSTSLHQLQASVEWLYSERIGGQEVSTVRQIDALKALLTKVGGQAAPSVVLVLKGMLGETAKAGELVVSADGLGIMAEGRVVYSMAWSTCVAVSFAASSATFQRCFPHRSAVLYSCDGRVHDFRQLLAHGCPLQAAAEREAEDVKLDDLSDVSTESGKPPSSSSSDDCRRSELLTKLEYMQRARADAKATAADLERELEKFGEPARVDLPRGVPEFYIGCDADLRDDA